MLGPLLLYIYLNLDVNVGGIIYKFADYVKIGVVENVKGLLKL